MSEYSDSDAGREADAGLSASLPELVSALSLGLDAAEGQEPGHAARVAYIATRLAEGMELGEQARRAAFYAGMLHDVGVPLAASRANLQPVVDEDLVFGPNHDPNQRLSAAQRIQADTLRDAHLVAGADFLNQAWFPADTADAVAASHEDWAGGGSPGKRAGDEIPMVGRLIRAADLFDGAVAEVSNPLNARAQARSNVAAWAGRELQPEIAEALSDVIARDDFWLGLYDHDIASGIVDDAPSGVPASGELLAAFSHAVAAIIDAKSGHSAGRGRHVAAYASAMASTLGMKPQRVELIGLAALWNDIGTLGVPNRILSKPSLLSVEEMERMRGHPNFSGQIIERIVALEPATLWVAAHHERVDGKGYPEMLSGAEISSEAGILSLADAYVAMISARPYRDPLTSAEARAIVDAGAGTQWDPFLVKVLLEIVRDAAAESELAISAS